MFCRTDFSGNSQFAAISSDSSVEQSSRNNKAHPASTAGITDLSSAGRYFAPLYVGTRIVHQGVHTGPVIAATRLLPPGKPRRRSVSPERSGTRYRNSNPRDPGAAARAHSSARLRMVENQPARLLSTRRRRHAGTRIAGHNKHLTPIGQIGHEQRQTGGHVVECLIRGAGHIADVAIVALRRNSGQTDMRSRRNVEQSRRLICPR